MFIFPVSIKTGKSGREYWEMDSLLAVKGNQIKDIIQNSNVQPPHDMECLILNSERYSYDQIQWQRQKKS